MRIELKKRENMSALFSVLSPFIALGLTLIAGVISSSRLERIRSPRSTASSSSR
jgi:hypothetical protein